MLISKREEEEVTDKRKSREVLMRSSERFLLFPVAFVSLEIQRPTHVRSQCTCSRAPTFSPVATGSMMLHKGAGDIADALAACPPSFRRVRISWPRRWHARRRHAICSRRRYTTYSSVAFYAWVKTIRAHAKAHNTRPLAGSRASLVSKAPSSFRFECRLPSVFSQYSSRHFH